MIMRKVIYGFWILVLGVCCREAPVRGSLILGPDTSLAAARDAQRNERLYEQVVAQRSRDPIRFDRLNPILGEMLTNRASFQYWLNRWQAHPARFEHWHPRFWRIIDGELLAGGPPVITPVITPVIPPLIPPTGEGGKLPPGLGSLPPAPPRLSHPPSPPMSAPEPGTSLLLIEALGLILIAHGGYVLLRSRSWRRAGE